MIIAAAKPTLCNVNSWIFLTHIC